MQSGQLVKVCPKQAERECKYGWNSSVANTLRGVNGDAALPWCMGLV